MRLEVLLRSRELDARLELARLRHDAESSLREREERLPP
jgi:hypothetical protein